MSSFDLGLILRVFTSPNHAFSQIRDNEEKYFAQAIGLLIASSALGIFLVLPFIMMPIDERYFENMGDEVAMNTGFPSQEPNAVISVGVSFLTGLVSAALFYFIGKKLEGNNNWKKVFAVILHTHAISIPIITIMSILLFFMWDAFTSIEPSVLLYPNIEEQEAISTMGPFIGYAMLLAIFGIGFFVWSIVVTVKAIKVVHGFGTGKAFGLFILVFIISSLLALPFGI